LYLFRLKISKRKRSTQITTRPVEQKVVAARALKFYEDELDKIVERKEEADLYKLLVGLRPPGLSYYS